jgi:hypothetical protein
MSWRERVTNSAWASLFGISSSSAEGEGSGRVSTTLMSEVLCMGSGEEARIAPGRKGFYRRARIDRGIRAKKVAGRLPLDGPPLLSYLPQNSR